jgi:Putative phage tail protein
MALKLLAPLAIAVGGSLISSLLFPSRKDTKGPERQNFSDAGIGPINWGVGTFWCTPRVIAQSEVRESGKGKQRNKKGGGKPRCDVVLLICKGPIQGVTRIIANGKVVFDIRPGNNRNYLDGLTSSWTILDGNQTTINPVLTSIVGSSTAASLNGWALLILEDLQLKDSGGSVPAFEVEVMRYPAEEPDLSGGASQGVAGAYIELDADPTAVGSAVPFTALDTGSAASSVGQIFLSPGSVNSILRLNLPAQSGAYSLTRLWRTGVEIPAGLISGVFTASPSLSSRSFTTLTSGADTRTFNRQHVPSQGGRYYVNGNLSQGYTASGTLVTIPYDFNLPGEVAISIRVDGSASLPGASGYVTFQAHSIGFVLTPVIPLIRIQAGTAGTVIAPSVPTGVIPRPGISFAQSVVNVGAFLQGVQSMTLTGSVTRPFYYQWVFDSGVTIAPPFSLGYRGTIIRALTGISSFNFGVKRAQVFLKQGNRFFKPRYNSTSTPNGTGTIINWYGTFEAFTRTGNIFTSASGSFSTSQPAELVHVIRWASEDAPPISGPGSEQVSSAVRPEEQVHLYQGGLSTFVRQSAYFSPLPKTVSVKVVQCQDGLERIYNYTTSGRVYGARIEFRQGAGITNVAGDIALEAEGRISVHTSTGTFPITPYLPALGAWYDRGNQVTPGTWEVARPLEIAPYCVWDEALDGEVYQIEPSTLPGDYYPVPSVQSRLPLLANALHNQPLSLDDITTQLLTDFPESVGQWYSQIENAVDPRATGESLFYGWTIDGQGSVFDSYSRLLASLGIDLVDNYGDLSYVSDNNRTLTQIQEDWISRKYNDETGAEEPFYTYEIMPETVSPDEIRLMFRDAGRDGEESLAYYRSPLFSEAQNSETISTNAVMAFATAQTLAFRLFARTATRGKKYTVRLNYKAFGSIDIGSLIRFSIVDSDRPIWDVASQAIRIDQPGWVINRTVTLLVSEIVIDENFNMEVIGYEFLTNSLPQPTINPGDLTSPPDGLPNSVLMRARVVDVPIWDGSTNTLQRHHQAIILSPGTDVVPSNESAVSTLGGPYEIINSDTPGDLIRTGTFTGGNPILGVIDEGSVLTFSGVIGDNFGSVSEALFLAGQGTWLQVGTEAIRARNVVWNGTAWVASYLLRGLLGTAFQTSGQVTVLSKLKIKDDTSQDLGVTRDIRTYAGIQSITSTPAAPFTQSGFTATPYLPKNLGSDRQPNGDRILHWQGHGLSNGVAVNGQKPLNISIGQSYDIELIGAPGAFTASAQNLTLSSAQLSTATGFRVRQRGDFALISGWTTFTW